VQADRTHTVHGTELVHVVANRTTEFDANESHTVAGNRSTAIVGNDVLSVGAEHHVTVGSNEQIGVGGNQSITVGGIRKVHAEGAHFQSTGASFTSGAAEHHRFSSPAFYITEENLIDARAGSAMLKMMNGMIIMDNGAGASIALIGSTIFVSSGDLQSKSGTHSFSSSGSNNLSSGTQTIVTASASLDLSSSGNVNASGASIKLNE